MRRPPGLLTARHPKPTMPRDRRYEQRLHVLNRSEKNTIGAAPIDFALSEFQLSLRDAIEKTCARFGDDYWLARDRDATFPEDFRRAIAADGWLGICIPEAYGGSGLGIADAAIMMETIAASGAGLSGASAVH